MALSSTNNLRSVFVTGLQNAHAVEQQALALIDRQLDRIVRYPEVSDRLRLHRAETQRQIQRLDDILASLGESHSSFKDMALNLVGNITALSHSIAADEILKNNFVNFAFENFEIASYRSLITLAEASSLPTAAALLETTLREEQAMASWIEERLPDLTLEFVGLREQGTDASH